jgi:DNA-binding MarR family transcriptional regulator
VHPSDRRIKVVVITPRGEEAKARAMEVLHEPPASMDTLTAAEQRTLRDLLAKLHAVHQKH